jgi:predicted amidohydrolase YtcJ
MIGAAKDKLAKVLRLFFSKKNRRKNFFFEKKKQKTFALFGLCFATAASAAPADLVFLHGRIHTQNERRDVVAALAIDANHIVAVGSDATVQRLIGAHTKIIDLAGRTVLPGIIDAHIHPVYSALVMDKCSLDDVPLDVVKLRAKVASCLKAKPGKPDEWFEVTQVNPSGLTLTRADLDSMLSDRPMLLDGSDGHTEWANSAALRALRIGKATPDPVGGAILRDKSGEPTGTLRDRAADIASDDVPAPSMQVQADLTDRALDMMRAVGITSVQDASVDDHIMSVYKFLYDAHRLRTRVRGCFHLKDLHADPAQVIAEATAFRRKWAIDPQYLRADSVKIFADGVIEYPSQTAALLAPYLDMSGHPTANVGPSYFTQPNLNRIVALADAAGFTVHVHAIGDRATRSALDAFAYTRATNGVSDNRHQIAHLELVDPGDFPRFKSLGVIANFQLEWAERDDYITAGTIPFIGPRRAKYLYPARSLRDAGAFIVGGSDWNAGPFDPFIAMEHGITRSESKGKPPLLPEQSLTLQNIVDAYTINAAHALKAEATTGSLEVGKLADLIILDRDIFRIDPYDLHNTKVLATYLDGRVVFEAK